MHMYIRRPQFELPQASMVINYNPSFGKCLYIVVHCMYMNNWKAINAGKQSLVHLVFILTTSVSNNIDNPQFVSEK